MKRLLVILYTLCLLVMAVATLVENSYGTDFAASHIYHSFWFIALWAALSLGLVAALVRYKLWQRWAVCSLHASFLVILLGALVTFATSQKGVVHLRPAENVSTFQSEDLATNHPLPFTLRLDSFHVVHYPGTEAPADYASYVTISSEGSGQQTASQCVSMNRILKHQGYRFYQSSYDPDEQGSWLSVNYDPWGTGLTYAGYLLLLLSMLAVLFSRKEEFVRLLRHPLLRKGTFVLLLLFLAAPSLQARQLPAFNRAKADSLAERQIIYNDRIAPFNTLARDFLLKIYGRTSYHGLTPEQVVSGWLFSPEVWQEEPMFLIKSAELRQLLHIEGKYARLTDLFQGTDYVLQRYWKGGNAQTAPNDPLQKAIAETDEKVGLIMMLQKGTLIQPLPKDGSVKPLSSLRIQAELLYNRLPFAKVLFMFCLTIGLLAFVRRMWCSVRQLKPLRWEGIFLSAAMYVCTAALAFAFGLRWYVAGHVPMSNGFETMQFMALTTLVVSSLLHRRFKVLLPFGFILAGFALLVSFLGQSNPQITSLMPVLASRWLSLHVSMVMMGYSLLAFVMLTGIMGLCMKRQAEALMLLGRLLLYPAVFFLGVGIFLGAVWANQSWGTYWSWDPKETWALITFMTYALSFHAQSLPWFRKPAHFHLFSVLAFLTVLMTYFGVNFVLGGMHSYAG